jgi:hypothetical protein
MCDTYIRARPERAIVRWQRAYGLLEADTTTQHIQNLRAPIAFALACQLATLGFSAAALESTPCA